MLRDIDSEQEVDRMLNEVDKGATDQVLSDWLDGMRTRLVTAAILRNIIDVLDRALEFESKGGTDAGKNQT